VNNQYVELTDFDLADSSTVEVTVKAFDFSGNQCILTKQNGGTTHFGLHLNAGNIILEMGGNQHNFGPLTMGFHRLSFVIDKPAGSSNAAVTLYRNGDLVGCAYVQRSSLRLLGRFRVDHGCGSQRWFAGELLLRSDRRCGILQQSGIAA
jgi:hypothetical protein